MSGIRISWAPSPVGIFQYQIYKGTTVDGPWLLLGIIPAGTTFFDDVLGTVTTIYKVEGVTDVATVAYTTGPFQIPLVKGADLTARVKVDHNYEVPDNLRYVAPGGQGVPNATIRVYKQADWAASRIEAALFVTDTDNDGRWRSPVFLEPGLTYVIVFSKQNAFGPNPVEITV